VRAGAGKSSRCSGASDRQIAALQQAEQINPNLVCSGSDQRSGAPRAVQNLGLVVNTAQELFSVVDLSTVWIMASVNEKDFASVRVGSAASICGSSVSRSRQWTGRVTYIQPQVDSTTRTAQARIEVTNPGENLRIDMYVDVEFTSLGRSGASRSGSRRAIHRRTSVCIFSLSKTTKEALSCVRVHLGPLAGGNYSVIKGLNERGPSLSRMEVLF